MIVGGTTVIKGRKCVAIKGRKSRSDDCTGNTGLGGLGWREEVERKLLAFTYQREDKWKAPGVSQFREEPLEPGALRASATGGKELTSQKREDMEMSGNPSGTRHLSPHRREKLQHQGQPYQASPFCDEAGDQTFANKVANWRQGKCPQRWRHIICSLHRILSPFVGLVYWALAHM